MLQLSGWSTALACLFFAMGGMAGALAIVAMPYRRSLNKQKENSLLKSDARASNQDSKREAERAKWKAKMEKKVKDEEAKDRKNRS